jgi:hypothetical protein
VFESPRARYAKSLIIAGDFTCSLLVEGFEQNDFWEPIARSDLAGRYRPGN